VHTVALLDDQPAGRQRLAALVRSDPRLHLVSAGPATGAVIPAGRAVALLRLPSGSGPGLLQLVSRVAAEVPVVVLSTWSTPPAVTEVVAAGARGCVPDDAGPEAVATALSTVAAGGMHLGGRLGEPFTAAFARPVGRPSGLAPREIETLRFIASGYTQSQIATRMGLSQATVNTYAKRIRHKLKVNNKAELTRKAVEFGYVDALHGHPAA
jgi:DNA-binding NarL/FixJ family response regulator